MSPELKKVHSFFCYSLLAYCMYRHESNDIFLFIFFFSFDRLPSICHNSISLVSSHSLLQSGLLQHPLKYMIVKLREPFFVLFFLQKGHSRHYMKMNNPLKGLSSGPVSNINRKQKHNMGLILTGNRHKQQVWEEECDFSYDVTGNLFVT